MSNLPAVDKLCFNCTLDDCVERNKNCPRRKYIQETKNYHKELRRYKMTTTLTPAAPIIVR